MKCFVLLCLLGVALSSSLTPEWRGVYWKSDTEYVFDYTGRLLTGIPELASHYSGVSIKCKVHLNVRKEGLNYRFGIRLTDAKYVRVNDVLHNEGHHESQGDNWRFVTLPPYSDLPSQHAEHLSNSVLLKLKESGEFDVLMVKDDEPEWSINFKKALAVLFQTKFGTGRLSVEEQLLQNNELVSQSDESEVLTWKTHEESLDGKCEVIYQLNELPSYVVKDKPELIPYPQECNSQSGKYFELIKTRDINSCTRYNSYRFYKPGFFHCGSGSCEGMWTRNSVTRYTACGTVDKLMIQTITNEGELQQNLFGIKTEKFLTGTRQTLKLLSARPSSSSSTNEIPSSRVMRSLYYEYTQGISHIMSEQSPEEIEKIQKEQESSQFKSIARNILTSGSRRDGDIESQKLIPEIKRIFKQLINEDFNDLVNVPKKQITMKALNIARSFSLLKKEDIRSIYDELKSEFSSQEKNVMFKNIFYDTLIMGGSHESILFIKEKIQSGDLSTVQVISMFSFLPHYVIAPREILLSNLYELITSNTIKENSMFYNHAVMSFSILLQKACMSDTRNISYPTSLYGEFCYPESRIVTEKWLPFLRRELEQTQSWEKKNVIITALGLMDHKDIVPILLPYVEQMNTESNELKTSRLTRFLAVYSLKKCGRKHREMVLPVLVSIFTNMAENTEVRIAAFNVIMKLNPSMTILQNIASSTWYERDVEILNVVNTAFYTLSNERDVSNLSQETESMQRKTWLVYPLIKKVGGRYPTSGTIYNSEYLRKLGVGYKYVNSWTASKGSLFPTDIYSKIIYVLERYEVSPIEFGLHMKGGESLIQQLIEILSPENEQLAGMNKEEIAQKVKEQIHGEWRQVIEQLGLKTRDNDYTESSIYVNLFENFPFFRTFQSSSSQMLKEKLSEVLRKDNICGNYKVNAQRMHNLAPAEFSVPSDMGLPIVIEVHMPVAVSFRGEMNVDCSTSLPSVQMDVRTLFASQMSGWVGTVCPFTEEYVVSGIDEHAVVNLPVEFKVDFHPSEKKLNLKLKPISDSVNSEVDIFHFHVRPFGIVQSYYNLTPMTMSNKVKFIESKTEMKKMEYPFGEQFGTSMKFVVNTESRFVDWRSLMERFEMFNWNPLNVLRFTWASTALSESGKPSLRRHEYQIKYDPSMSSTKEIDFQLQIDTVTKEQGSEIKTHKIVVDESKVVPYKLKKVPVSFSETESVQKAKQILERSNIRDGTGVAMRLSTVLKGSRTRSWNYNLQFALGTVSNLKSKWDLHLENEQGNKVCMNGEVNLPNLPIWKIEELRNSNVEVHFRNEFGYGRDCSDYKIKVNGESRVSQKQKQYSKVSGDAKLLQKLIERNVPLAELSEVADRVRVQTTTLDEVDFNIEYQNVPEHLMRKSKYLIETVKAFWWPYIIKDNEGSSNGQIRGSMTSTWKFYFDPSTRSFDLTINRPDEHLSFQHIRIPYPLTYFFPTNVLRGPVAQAVKSLTGRSIQPVCSLEKRWVKTFDNKTMNDFPFDTCFKLITSDCSEYKRFSVLMRAMEEDRDAREIKFFIGKTSVLLTPSVRHSRYNSDVSVKVNGTEQQLIKGQVVDIKDRHGEVVLTVKQSVNGVLEVRFKWLRILFDGYKTQLFATSYIKNQLCGICGDLNNQISADVLGPKMCVYSTSELLAAAYRVSIPSHRCDTQLEGDLEQRLRQEQEQCVKYREVPTKVVKSFLSSNGECTKHRHEIINRDSMMCFSRKPLPQCGRGCQPLNNETVEKSVSFTCMQSGRTARHYEQKVQQGQILPELEQMSETFTVRTPLPKVCVPAQRY